MAAAEKDYLESADDGVSIADGGGPFQEYDDVPGRTSKQLGTTSPDYSSRRKRSFRGTVKDDLAGR